MSEDKKKEELPKKGFLRTGDGNGGVELFHADIEEEKIRVMGSEKISIMGNEKEISPHVINVRITLWDVDENGEARIDPDTKKPKTITVEKYIKSIDIEKSVIILQFGKKKIGEEIKSEPV